MIERQIISVVSFRRHRDSSFLHAGAVVIVTEITVGFLHLQHGGFADLSDCSLSQQHARQEREKLLCLRLAHDDEKSIRHTAHISVFI